MQYRIQVGLHFYSVTVIEEDQGAWLAMAEIADGWLVQSCKTPEGALDRWQSAAQDMMATARTESCPAAPPSNDNPVRKARPRG